MRLCWWRGGALELTRGWMMQMNDRWTWATTRCVSVKCTEGKELSALEQLLGLPVTCTTDEVKKAYRRLAIKYHPDKNPDDPAAGTPSYTLFEHSR